MQQGAQDWARRGCLWDSPRLICHTLHLLGTVLILLAMGGATVVGCVEIGSMVVEEEGLESLGYAPVPPTFDPSLDGKFCDDWEEASACTSKKGMREDPPKFRTNCPPLTNRDAGREKRLSWITCSTVRLGTEAAGLRTIWPSALRALPWL